MAKRLWISYGAGIINAVESCLDMALFSKPTKDDML
jgi:hypothetical protein